MGQKVNPIGLRLSLNKKWQSRWFANKKDFGKYLQEDIFFLSFSISLPFLPIIKPGLAVKIVI